MKVVGFLRLLPLSPAPVLPIFADNSGSGSRFVQVISSDGLVDGFAPIDSIPTDRLIIMDEPSYPDVIVGQEALLAFDRGETNIALRRGEKYRHLISELVSSRRPTMSSFALLEMSLLVGDRQRAFEAANECISLMGGPNSSLARRWIAGGTIPEAIKVLLATPSEEQKTTIADEDGKYWVVTFGGPKFLVRGLTIFCAEILHTTRADAIRQLFTSGSLDTILAVDDISMVSSGIAELLDRSPNVGRYLMRTRTSWGRVSLAPGVDPNWISPAYDEFNRHLSNSRELLRLRISGLDLNNTRGRLLFFLWCYFMKKTGQVTYIQDHLDLSEMHSGSEIDRAAGATNSN